MKLISGVVNNIIFIIKKKKPTEIREKIKIAKPKRNLNKASIVCLIINKFINFAT